MRVISIIGLVVIALFFFKVITLQALGLLALLIAIVIGAYFLFTILLGFVALGTMIFGIFMVISLITYSLTNL